MDGGVPSKRSYGSGVNTLPRNVLHRLDYNWIVRKVCGNKTLRGVPKIFIFDCCRGSKVSLKKSWKN